MQNTPVIISSCPAASIVTVPPAWHFFHSFPALLQCSFFGDALVLVYFCVTDQKRVQVRAAAAVLPETNPRVALSQALAPPLPLCTHFTLTLTE
ncbi:hypothetical protein HBH56_241180 [Parastagonospora nodorum]|uniref:Uncharacterized protein n=1 Tax=Phaeosphaeria nodorum (strain SN15 / ATCC MYA-4574 / FGSC 10173) TaxID=321614 RepID=A0A7U2FEI5_PHANO|nr:hypothetical protein HBH56_241180 [Parastagonospora nodorum]QRD03794.1 hypothetical protein JI435_442370 [Parastagonospora nodorum SN15]KAH3921262.1 hypothetical protein HBH54_243220 [Parastagonospora nodorum]KAH3939078.1 hypothetical protein HBH53_241150 [Parastagonospora nodorum]KAH3957041.1 hypothetical protein HBH51_230640 [Parastagonospora nodorum]